MSEKSSFQIRAVSTEGRGAEGDPCEAEKGPPRRGRHSGGGGGSFSPRAAQVALPVRVHVREAQRARVRAAAARGGVR